MNFLSVSVKIKIESIPVQLKFDLFFTLQFDCETTALRKVQASLKDLGTSIVFAGMEFVPRTQIALDEEQIDAASTLVEVLNEYPDVVRVWDNIQTGSWGTFPRYSVDVKWDIGWFVFSPDLYHQLVCTALHEYVNVALNRCNYTLDSGCLNKLWRVYTCFWVLLWTMMRGEQKKFLLPLLELSCCIMMA